MINQADSLKDFPGLLDCVHCGLCLDSCPTYKVSGSEADSPRGRLALLRAVQEGRLKDEEAADPLERCLLCRACEPACPSQVPYHEAWSHWQNQRGPATASRLLATLATPWRLRLLGVAARLAKSLGILRITERWAPRGLARRAGSIPSHPSRWRPEKTIKPAQKQLRGRIGLHIGCVNGEFFGATLRNLTSLLNAQGFEIVIPHQPTCCGALHGHSGAGTEGRSLANETLKSFSDDLDAILSPSAGCVGWLNEIQSGKIREPMAFLHEVGMRGKPQPVPERILYDPPCHLKNVLGDEEAVPALLSAIPELEIIPHDEADLCCGAGGIAFLRGEESADAVLHRKVSALKRAGQATRVVTGNPGCLMRLESELRFQMPHIKVEHPINILAEAWRPNTA